MLEAAIRAIDVTQEEPPLLTQFVAVAVGQQLDRPTMAQLLEIKEERLGASVDIDPVRERVAIALSGILAVAERPAGSSIVQDVMALIATLVDAAASRGERNGELLLIRI